MINQEINLRRIESLESCLNSYKLGLIKKPNDNFIIMLIKNTEDLMKQLKEEIKTNIL